MKIIDDTQTETYLLIIIYFPQRTTEYIRLVHKKSIAILCLQHYINL